MKTIITLVFALLFFHANAGDEIGNGGDVVICNDASGAIISAKMLDYYEGQHREITLDLGEADLTPHQKVELALERLFEKNNFFANLLRQKAQAFFEQVSFKKNIQLRDIPDSNEVFLERGCAIHQIAINQKVLFPGDKKYLISKDLWDLLDNDNKAGLILHEIIYDSFINQGHVNSRSARYLNSRLSSKAFEGLSMEEYYELKKLLNFQYSLDIWDALRDYDLEVGKVYTFLFQHPVKVRVESDLYCVFAQQTIETGIIHPFMDRFRVFERISYKTLLKGDKKACEFYETQSFTSFKISNKAQTKQRFDEFAKSVEEFDTSCANDNDSEFFCRHPDLRNLMKTTFQVGGKTYSAHSFQRYYEEVDKESGEVYHFNTDYIVAMVNPHLPYQVSRRTTVNGKLLRDIKLISVAEGPAPVLDNLRSSVPFYSSFYIDGSQDIEGWKASENWDLLNSLELIDPRNLAQRFYGIETRGDYEKAYFSGINVGEMLGEQYSDRSCTFTVYADYVVLPGGAKPPFYRIAKIDRVAQIHSYYDLAECQEKLKDYEARVSKAVVENLVIEVHGPDKIGYKGQVFIAD